MHTSLLSKLRPHQPPLVEHLHEVLQHNQAAVDASDTGCGKTYVAACVAHMLQLPTLVVCPFIAMTQWRKAAAHFNDSFSVINYEMLRTGRTPYGTWQRMDVSPAYARCTHCLRTFKDEREILREPCYTNQRGLHCIEWKKKKPNRGNFTFHPGVRLAIFDEVHRCNGIGTDNAEMLIGARRDGVKILGLSATLGETPIKWRALGYALGLHNLKPGAGLVRRADGQYSQLPGFEQWAAHHGCRRDPKLGPGLHWLLGEAKQREVMTAIRAQVIPARGVRISTEDIPGFPEREITAELYDLDKPEAVNALYEEMRRELDALTARMEGDLAPESALTKILRAHQKVELLKVPVALELWRDLREKGFSIGFFCNYQQTIDALCERLNTNCVVDGTDVGVRYRQANIGNFQTNTSREIVLNNKAGGICVDLQDLQGGFPRAGLVFPCFDIVTMRQLAGRFHRDGGKSKCFYRVMFAANTIEEDMYRAWRAKSNNLDALNDADLSPFGIPLTKI